MPPTPSPSPIYIQMVGEPSAFWDSPLLIAFIAVGGVVVGSLLGYFTNLWQDNRKAKREDLRKWDDQVLTRASSAIALARRVGREKISDPQREKESRPVISMGPDGEVSVTMPVAWLTYQELTAECAAISFIAPPLVLQATDALQLVTRRQLMGRGTVSDMNLDMKVNEAIENLRDAIRVSFGLESKP